MAFSRKNKISSGGELKMIPLKINGVDLWTIMDPDDINNFEGLTSESAKIELALKLHMFPSEVRNTSETYSTDAERTANYELEELILVNAKAKPEFTWSYLRTDYAKNLLEFLGFNYNYKDSEGVVTPREAPTIKVTYWDFIGERTISAYLGQTIEGVLVEHQGKNYWETFRIAFPER